jgi:type I restriction enzyme S subunit
VKYLLDHVKRRFENISRGTTQSNLSLDKLLSVSVMYPEFDMQRKIATILSAYDDLIENNNRRITILEEMAQRIYREWFVAFRYPGHESVPLVESELGYIPRGWSVEHLGDVLSLLEAGSRPRGGVDPSERGVPSVGAENVLGLGRYNFGKEKFVSQTFFEQMRRGRVADGDVVLYKDGAYIGRVSMFRDGFPHTSCAVNEHVFILRTNDSYSQILLYLWLAHRGNQDRVRALNANAAQPGLNQEKLRALTLVVPPAALVRRLTESIEPIIALVFRLALATSRTRECRDLLLPRLIAGEIDVADLHITVPEPAA